MSLSRPVTKVHEIVEVKERGRRDCRGSRVRYMRLSRSVNEIDEIVEVNEQGI